MGKFANFCYKIGVKNYTGIDIDDYFFDECRDEFPSYKFINTSFQKYLENRENEFDIIFTSHVFEHLDEKTRVEIIENIYSSLKKNGKWINYMPNADAILWVWIWRWSDITHKTIYDDISFSQVINSSNANFVIENYNHYIWVKSKLRRIIHLMFRFFTKIYYLWMGHKFPEFYTREFINVLTKK